MRSSVSGLFSAIGRRVSSRTSVEQAAIISYPKSGSTWLRLMLGTYIQGVTQAEDLPLLDQPDAVSILGTAYRFQVTHAPLEWEGQIAKDLSSRNCVEPYLGKRVLLLSRYPLDVMISSFMQAAFKPGTKNPYQKSIGEFVYDEVFGLEKYFRFYEIWAKAMASRSVVKVCRYEDLWEQPESQLFEILNFMGLPINREALRLAVSQCSFQTMKLRQFNPEPLRYESSRLPIFGQVDPSDPRSHHVRRGGIGTYRLEMPRHQISEFEKWVRRSMPSQFGYADPPSLKEQS
jgi:hypothetical protein